MASGDSRKVVLAALFANLGIAIVKGIAAVVTRSGAMLAETIHSVADAGNQALLLLGAARAKRPPDKRHPFGYGTERYFWAFVVALVLFSLGALFSLYEGTHKLLDPEPLRKPAWAYGVLIVAIFIETLSFLVAHRAVKRSAGPRGFRAFLLESKDPSLPVVYLEDAGALLGLVLALMGVSASHLLGWHWADGAASISVGLLLGVIAAILLRRCHGLLVGEGASTEDEAAIRGVVEAAAELVELRTLHVGPEYLLVALEVRSQGGPGAIRELEEAIRARVPRAKYVAIELL